MSTDFVSECQDKYLSTVRKSGTFSFPKPDGAGTSCRYFTYLFSGVDGERVMISFQHLNLYYPHGDPRQPEVHCNGVDSVTVYITVKRERKMIGIFCGNKRPPMLMSSDEHLEVQFNGRSSSATSGTGFSANYSFVTDFGIKQGVQDKSLECRFRFDSRVSSNGTFTSPNFPGQYPRNTECHYLFYGQTHEQVIITFLYFDVEGVRPMCLDSSNSDYVEFSNFNVHLTDRQMGRICGSDAVRTNSPTKSDSNFFRVSFKANNMYDASGFQARYQFQKDAEDESPAGRRTHVIDGSGRHVASIWCLVCALCTLLLTAS